MPRTQALANVTHSLNSNAWNVAAKMQQSRSLHMHEMSNLYMEACLSGLPTGYLSLLETTMNKRSLYNNQKSDNDSMLLSDHDMKLKNALEHNPNVLSGGAVSTNTRNARQALKYSTKRTNALLENLNQKLMHDRSVHMHELVNLYNEARRVGIYSPYVKMLNTMLSNRKMYDNRRTQMDATEWASGEAFARQQLRQPLSSEFDEDDNNLKGGDVFSNDDESNVEEDASFIANTLNSGEDKITLSNNEEDDLSSYEDLSGGEDEEEDSSDEEEDLSGGEDEEVDEDLSSGEDEEEDEDDDDDGDEDEDDDDDGDKDEDLSGNEDEDLNGGGDCDNATNSYAIMKSLIGGHPPPYNEETDSSYDDDDENDEDDDNDDDDDEDDEDEDDEDDEDEDDEDEEDEEDKEDDDDEEEEEEDDDYEDIAEIDVNCVKRGNGNRVVARRNHHFNSKKAAKLWSELMNKGSGKYTCN